MRGTARRVDDRQRMRRAAAERVGHENAYLILFVEPALRMILPPIALGLAGWWLWVNVDHGLIATVSGVAGAVLVVAYVLSGFLAGRSHSLAGARHRHIAWHIAGGIGVALIVGALVLANA